MVGNDSTTEVTRHSLFLALGISILLMVAGPTRSARADSLENAQKAAAKGEWKEAADIYAGMLQKSASHRAAALGLTEAAIKAGLTDLYPMAEDSLLTIKEKSARDWDIRIALGQLSLAIGASKEDTLAKKSYDSQAIECFEAALKGRPDSEPAAAGLARTHFESAQFQKAADVVDAFLRGNPKSSAKALFWKGQALYYLARDAYNQAGGGAVKPAQLAVFRRAQGAYRSSAAGDPSSYETWIQLAYASQYVADFPEALQAYLKAAGLNHDSAAPLKGIEALHAHDAAGLIKALKGLLEKHPKHAQALFFLGYNRYASKDKDDDGAIEYLGRFVKVAQQPAEGWYWLGKAHERKDDEAQAVAAFERALKANPDHLFAAWALDLRIQRSGSMQKAAQSVEAAQELIATYERLFKLAPRNASVRNNLAFTLREAYGRHKGSKTWLPILKACTEQYVKASEILGEWDAQKEATLPWATRYGNAQIISDTGLMYQFYDETRDLEKAEMYYELALEYTQDGYKDAFNNLSQVLIQQERWEDLYDLAAVCMEGIKTEQGTPDEGTRARAKALMDKLLKDGKVRD